MHVRLALLAIESHDMHERGGDAEAGVGGGWMQCDKLDPQGTYMIVTNGAGVEGQYKYFRAFSYSRRCLHTDLG